MKRHNAQLGSLCFAAVVFGSLLAENATAQPTYRITDLGTLLGGAGNSEAFGLNGQRQVVGWATADNGQIHAFVWLPQAALGLPAGLNDLGLLPGADPQGDSIGHNITESGKSVGLSTSASGADHAFLWLPPGDIPPGLQQGMNDLGSLAGDTGFSEAWAINNADPFQIVGSTQVPGPHVFASRCSWGSSGTAALIRRTECSLLRLT